MIQFNIWKDPGAKCIRWNYSIYKFNEQNQRAFVRSWEGPSIWYGKEFVQSFKMWKRQYR